MKFFLTFSLILFSFAYAQETASLVLSLEINEKSVNQKNVYLSPKDLQKKLDNPPSGLYWFSINGDNFLGYCDTSNKDRFWVLLFNSVGNPRGSYALGDNNTLNFWKIPYANRFGIKGTPSLQSNYYNGFLYLVGCASYKDEVEDKNNKVVTMLQAEAKGILYENMNMVAPSLIKGDEAIYIQQFASGWCSFDYDSDFYDVSCSKHYGNVTQHYKSCWYYNLGADAEAPVEDFSWGPHMSSDRITALGLAGDGSGYSRVNRITRWIYWEN
jgi:hypothetical protein